MKQFGNVVWHLLKIHLLGLFVLTLLRIGLFYVGADNLQPQSIDHLPLQLQAFVRGVWFDNVVGCYLLIVPLAVCMVACLWGRFFHLSMRILTLWLQVLWSIVIFVSAADIPYFTYFFKHINSSIWNWAEYVGTTLGMLWSESSYYPPLIAFIVLTSAFVWISNHWLTNLLHVLPDMPFGWRQRAYTFLVGAVCVGLCMFGIRGRLGYNPIKVSAAYYCTDSFLNQLGVNPTYNLITSTLDEFRPENKDLHLAELDVASAAVAEYYNWIIEPDTTSHGLHRSRLNVVLIFMESMSANLMECFGNTGHLTPFLDSLAHRSLCFTNCYSADIHTNHGLFATLYSFPALMRRNMMKGTNIPHYEGLPTVLRDNGWHTMFFMTHEAQYDNMNAFFRTNGYDDIHSQENYPANEVVNSFGVPDHYLFQYALDTLANVSEPFFATLLTISNHPPYVIPSWFKPRSADIEQQIVEYADEALRQFFNQASHQPWFQNTVFVLVGDHGKLVGGAESEMPTSYNHVPLLICSPHIEPAVNSSWATQMDIQPTLLGLLGLSARHKHFGIDLLHRQRPYSFYTADDVIGVRGQDRLLIVNPSNGQEFCYRDGVVTNEKDSMFIGMKSYLFNNLQVAQEMVKQHGK
ncbi:MAG: LTA synthase family protein [Bacteroidales bacterium]|nr:LTA synthase family protein [Bacteroidales bacterium]